MRHNIAGAVFAMLVAGCATMKPPLPPSAPTALEISQAIAETKQLEKDGYKAVEVAVNGYRLVDEQCNTFFNAVQRWSNSTGLARKETTLVGAAAAGVLGAISATATSIALTAIGFGLAADSLDNFQNFALFSPRPAAVSRLVREAMAAYRQSAPPENPATYDNSMAQARDFVSAYAALCTYERIQEFVEQAVAKAEPVDKGVTTLFSVTDKIALGGVNSLLGLGGDLLADDAYVRLAWYLGSLYKDAQRRGPFLDQYFPKIKAQLLDVAGNLPNNAKAAAKLLDEISQRNDAFAKAVVALVKANPPPPAPAPDAAAAAVPVPVPTFVMPASASATRGIPNIVIR